MGISLLSWTGCDSRTWHLRTIMTMAIVIDGSDGERSLFQGRAITTSRVVVAEIEEAVDLITYAFYVARSHMENLVPRNGGREKAFQKKEGSIILQKEMIKDETQILGLVGEAMDDDLVFT